MTAALTLLPLVLQYIPTITTGVEHLWAWVESLRAAASQSAEWTDALESNYRATLQATGRDAAYIPDPK